MSPQNRRIVVEVAVWWIVCQALLLASVLIAGAGGFWARNAGILPAAFCLLFPAVLEWKLRLGPDALGLSARPFLKPLAIAAVLCLIVFPFYIAGYEFWSRLVSGRPFTGFGGLGTDWSGMLDLVMVQVIAVALPEEVFYRGWMQSRLALIFQGRVRVLGASIGWHIPVTAALFALSHLVLVPAPFRLAVFFPALLFGWLRERTGSVVAPIAFHAACNILLDLLQKVH